MWRVTLNTKHGEFVAKVLLPPYVRMPEVIVWGERYFQLCDDHRYWEVVAVVAWTAEELDQQGRGGFSAGAIRDYEGPGQPGVVAKS